jgi:predicted TIM-barrel fold metal-dependent hydrolase
VLVPIAQWPYGDPFYHPIFEAAQRHNLAIAMHHAGQVQSALGRGRYYIEWHVNVPQGAMSMLTSLVCNGVFDKFPSLQFAMIESGLSWLPHLLWRFDQNYKSLHQEIPWVKQLPSRHIRERVKFSTQPTEDFSAENWLRLIDMLETDRMFIFATDYPHWDFDSPDESIPRSLPEDLKQRIFYQNARELYNLD